MNKEQRIELIEEARAMGLPAITIEGVTYQLPPPEKVRIELTPEQLKDPMTFVDEMTEEEIRFWHTDYYDELQARKQAMQKRDRSEP